MSFYLGILGTEEQLRKLPTESSTPRIFNLNMQPLWRESVREVFSLPDELSVHDTWRLATLKTRNKAIEQNLWPWTANASAKNDQIEAYLVRERRNIVRFFKKNSLLARVLVRKSKTSVTLHDNGFTVICDGWLWPDKNIDSWAPDVFRLKRRGVRYSSPVQANFDTNIELWNEYYAASMRWHLSYSISTYMGFPYLEDVHLPTEQQLKDTILTRLWMPIRNQLRVDNRPFIYRM